MLAQQAIQRANEKLAQATEGQTQIDPIAGLELLNEAHLYITTQLHLIPDATYLVTTVAGQQEYPLPDNVATIWDAAYWRGGFVASGSNYKPLKATNTDTLFEDRGPTWQLNQPGTPWGYYERGGNVGFVDAPSVSGDQVQIFYTQATTLTAQTQLPTNIPSPWAWIYHVCFRAAPMPLQAGFDSLFQREMKLLREYVHGRIGRDRARVSYRVKRVRRA